MFALTCLISILSVKYTEFEQNFDVFSNYLESFNAYEEALRLNPSSIDAARGRERASAELQ